MAEETGIGGGYNFCHMLQIRICDSTKKLTNMLSITIHDNKNDIRLFIIICCAPEVVGTNHTIFKENK